eukprot:12818929-Alexandrium_andersonii.AAC.1
MARCPECNSEATLCWQRAEMRMVVSGLGAGGRLGIARGPRSPDQQLKRSPNSIDPKPCAR